MRLEQAGAALQVGEQEGHRALGQSPWRPHPSPPPGPQRTRRRLPRQRGPTREHSAPQHGPSPVVGPRVDRPPWANPWANRDLRHGPELASGASPASFVPEDCVTPFPGRAVHLLSGVARVRVPSRGTTPPGTDRSNGRRRSRVGVTRGKPSARRARSPAGSARSAGPPASPIPWLTGRRRREGAPGLPPAPGAPAFPGDGEPLRTPDTPAAPAARAPPAVLQPDRHRIEPFGAGAEGRDVQGQAPGRRPDQEPVQAGTTNVPRRNAVPRARRRRAWASTSATGSPPPAAHCLRSASALRASGRPVAAWVRRPSPAPRRTHRMPPDDRTQQLVRAC